MSEYRRKKASLLEAVFVAQDTWRHLTKPQRRALLGEKPVHPKVKARLHEMRLLRADGKPTAWGQTVLRFTCTMRKESA